MTKHAARRERGVVTVVITTCSAEHMDGGGGSAGRAAELAAMKLRQLAKLAEDAMATGADELDELVECSDKAVRTVLQLRVAA